MDNSAKNAYLRHTLSTIGYRFRRCLENAPDSFGDFIVGQGVRSPTEIICHMYSVLNWTTTYMRGGQVIKEGAAQLSYRQEKHRFRIELIVLDGLFSEKEVSPGATEKLLQGPLADILTHIGQLAMLCRLNGHPIPGEDFSKAALRAGEF